MADSEPEFWADSGTDSNQDQDQFRLHLSTWDYSPSEKYLRRYLSPKERTTKPASTRGPRATLAHRENRLGQRQLHVRLCIEPIESGTTCRRIFNPVFQLYIHPYVSVNIF